MVLASGVASALTLGNNITISDLVGNSTGWYSVDREDEEVEPNCVTGQQWDLEAFFLNNTLLTLVSGYDLENGETGSGLLFEYGDLFIDVDGNAEYGPANTGTGGDDSYPSIVNDTFGYDYVLTYGGGEDASGNPLFDAYALNTGDSTLRVWYTQNDESNPWRYDSGGDLVYSGSFNYFEGLSDAAAGGLLGGTHYAAQVDLRFLYDLGVRDFTSHFTYECGNDNLMGQSTLIIPEPATMTLMGLGLAGITVFRLRRKTA